MGVYIKSSRSYTVSELQAYNLSSEYLELLWVKIKHQSRRDILLGILYRPPQADAKKCFKYLADCINGIPRINRSEIFLLGDYNIIIIIIMTICQTAQNENY